MQYSLIPLKHNYEFIGDFHEGLAFVRKDSVNFNAGYIDKKAFEVIPTVYLSKFTVRDQSRFIHYPLFVEGRAALINNKGKLGYVNPHNEICVPFEYDNTVCFSESLAAVQKGDKWGYVDKTGNCVTSFEYDMAYDFYDDLAMVIKNGRIGYINKKGEVAIDFQFDIYFQSDYPKNTGFYNCYATVVRNNQVVVINKNGDIVIAPDLKYENIGIFEKGYAIVISKFDNKLSCGVIDIFGNVVIPSKFRYICPFGEDFIAVDDKGKTALMKNDGNVYKNLDFDEVGELKQELAFVKKDNKFGFIDKDGELVIPLEFDMAYSFYEGYAVVEKDGKFGLIDKYGHLAVPLIFESASSLSEGVSVVTKNCEKMLCMLEY